MIFCSPHLAVALVGVFYETVQTDSILTVVSPEAEVMPLVYLVLIPHFGEMIMHHYNSPKINYE